MTDRTPSRPDRMQSIPGVAELCDVSERTVRRWIQAGALAAHKLGRQWRISGEDLRAFLAQRRH